MIEYRKLTHGDYDDILEMCKDIWGGTDYLPELFHSWVDDRGMFLGAVDTDTGKVIGADKYSILYDGTGWLEGLRVHKDYRGHGIAKELALKTLAPAKEDLKSGKTNKIAFSTHISSVESIDLMKKLGFELEQQYMLIEKSFENMDASLTFDNFKAEQWNLSYEEFKGLDYFKKRGNLLPFVFYFQEPTPELYDELRKDGCFVSINGYKGMFKFKGEPHFICFEETITSIDTFMNYYLLAMKGKSLTPPLTSVRQEDIELIEALRSGGYINWSNWQCDYYYFVYKQF